MENGQQVDGTAVLQAKLNEPKTIAALTRLLDRIDSLEETVGKLATAVEQMPGMMAMAADTVDGAYKQAAEQGIDVDARLRTTLELAEKLTAPAMVARLDGLLALAEQAPGLAAMTADAVDDAYKQAAVRGVDVDARLRAGLEIAEKLTAPEMVERLDGLLTMAEQAPGLAAMTADAVDDAYKQAAARGVDIDARLRGGLEIAEKLSAPDMIARLNGLLAMAEQAPGLAAMTADAVDDTYKQAAARGVDIDARLRAGLEIAEKLTAPEMIARLDSLLAMAEQAPGLAAMTADIMDGAYRQAAQNGVDIDARMRAGLEIAEKLTSPDMVAKLNSAIDIANQGPGLAAMAVDVIDDAYQQAVVHGTDPEQLIRQSVMVVSRLAELLESGEVNNLLDSGIIAPEAVTVIGSTAQALIESRAEPPQKVGLFGMLTAMRDPDMQRAIGFLMSFGKQFGQKL